MTSAPDSTKNSALVEVHDVCGKVEAIDARVDLIFEEIEIVAIIDEEIHRNCNDGILSVKLSSSFYAESFAIVNFDNSILQQSYRKDGFFRASLFWSKIDGDHWKAGFSKYQINIAVVASSKCLLDGDCNMQINTSLTFPSEKYDLQSIFPSNCIIGGGFGLTFVCPDRSSTLYSTVGDKSSQLIADLTGSKLEATRESITIILSAAVGALLSVLISLIGFEKISKLYGVRKTAELNNNNTLDDEVDDLHYEKPMTHTQPSPKKVETTPKKQISSPSEAATHTVAGDKTRNDV